MLPYICSNLVKLDELEGFNKILNKNRETSIASHPVFKLHTHRETVCNVNTFLWFFDLINSIGIRLNMILHNVYFSLIFF